MDNNSCVNMMVLVYYGFKSIDAIHNLHALPLICKEYHVLYCCKCGVGVLACHHPSIDHHMHTVGGTCREDARPVQYGITRHQW